MQASMEQIINEIEKKGKEDKGDSLDSIRLGEDSIPMKPVN